MDDDSIPCKTCNGTGYLTNDHSDEPDCYDCQGTGRAMELVDFFGIMDNE